MSSVAVIEPVAVVQAPDLTITEYIGNVASGTPAVSACVCEVRKATEEAYQCPEFDEYVMVLEGCVHLKHAGGVTCIGRLDEKRGGIDGGVSLEFKSDRVVVAAGHHHLELSSTVREDVDASSLGLSVHH